MTRDGQYRIDMSVTDFRTIIDLFPNRREFARAIGVKVKHVDTMYTRNSIPTAHAGALFRNEGKRLARAGLTPLDFMDLYADKLRGRQ
jgi:uncharacterized HAD superfamily protein